MSFQGEQEVVTWKILSKSSPEKAYAYLIEDELREKWWVEKSQQKGETIRLVFPNGLKSTEKIIETRENISLTMTYLGSRIKFILKEVSEGTVITVKDYETSPEYRCEIIAGWGSVLMSLKATLDFGIDLRNHNKEYTWDQGFFDN